MDEPGKRRALGWRRVVAVSVAVAAVGAGVLAFPVVLQTLEEREEQRLLRLYATGLSPCDHYPDDIDALIQKHLPAPASVSITVFPSFSEPQAVRIVGDDLYYFVLDFPLYERGDRPPPKLNTEGVPTTRRSRIPRAVTTKLAAVLASDIAEAKAELPLGLDGAVFFFRTSGSTCGMAWSPDRGSRALSFVEIFDLLAKHAKASDPAEAAAKDREILRIIKSLQAR